MKIAILGTGNVGGALGRGWSRHGFEVVFGTRNPLSPKVHTLLESCGPTARATTVSDAFEFADTVALAIPFESVADVLRAHDVHGKVLVDATNPIGADMTLLHGHTTSGAEQIAAWAPGARVVKCFNTTGWENLADPRYGDVRTSMFYCGDDREAKHQVRQLVEALDLEPVDAGPLRNARYLEPLAMLWIHLAHVEGLGRNIAFKLVRRAGS